MGFISTKVHLDTSMTKANNKFDDESGERLASSLIEAISTIDTKISYNVSTEFGDMMLILDIISVKYPSFKLNVSLDVYLLDDRVSESKSYDMMKETLFRDHISFLLNIV